MVPATTPYAAQFRHDFTTSDNRDLTHYSQKPVIAWTEQGEPLVAGDRKLVRASDNPEYTGLVPAPSVVAVLPGGGWLAEYESSNGALRTESVLGWAVRSDGSGAPLLTNVDGELEDAAELCDFSRVYLPDEVGPRSVDWAAEDAKVRAELRHASKSDR